MADLSDVEAALVSAVMAALYSADVGALSVTGQPVRVYRGWPVTGGLDRDLAAGIVNVSVFAVPGATRNTTRWGPVTHTVPGQATMRATVSGNAVRFDGVGGVGQVVGLLVDGQPFMRRGQANDTPALIAAMMAESVRSQRACWLSGVTISVPGARSIVARTVADGGVLTEWARQEQGFRVSAWCPDPATRDLVCSRIGQAMATNAFLTLADGTAGRIRYRSTTSVDDAQSAQLYRRDLLYDVEYATSVQTVAPSMLFGDVHLSDADHYG